VSTFVQRSVKEAVGKTNSLVDLQLLASM
jgi:hypothetical protein